MFSVRIRWYIRRLKSKDRDVRKAAAKALGEIGSKEVVPHLRKALKDKDRDVRKAAAEALGKEGIGDNASSNKDSIYLFYSNSNTITA